ncbi:hypothetical protein [Natrononativus amylolyticus]|uniref:hypothetical protein n=1 Tax=Natrononativus amylolyticus TaxID=2963434 RepID=UPI0020CD47A3|nr:hypothetical protein [Natrononativus amylolyticus]
MRRRHLLAASGPFLLAGCADLADDATPDRDPFEVDDAVPSSTPDEDFVDLPESLQSVGCPVADLEFPAALTRSSGRSYAMRLELARARTARGSDGSADTEGDADDAEEGSSDDEPAVRSVGSVERAAGVRVDVGVWPLADLEYDLELWPGESVENAPRVDAGEPALEPDPITTAIDEALESGAERRVEDDALVADLYYELGTSQFRIDGRDEPLFARILLGEVHDMVEHRPESVAHYFLEAERGTVYRAGEPGEIPSRATASVDADDWVALECP